MSALWITKVKWDESELGFLQYNLFQQIHLYFLRPEQTRESVQAIFIKCLFTFPSLGRLLSYSQKRMQMSGKLSVSEISILAP